MARPKDDPALVRAESWEGLAALVGGGYDMGTREVCDAFEASRSWVGRYVRPRVPHVYVPAKLRRLMPADGDDLVLYDTSALRAMALDGAVYEARTRSVELDGWLTQEGALRVAEARLAVPRARTASEAEAAARGVEEAVWEGLDGPGRLVLDAARSLPAASRRAAAPWEPVAPSEARAGEWPRGERARWETAAGMRGWGDSDEAVARRLYRAGAVRVTLRSMGDRVMYAERPPAPGPREHPWLTPGALSVVAVPQAAWDALSAPGGPCAT